MDTCLNQQRIERVCAITLIKKDVHPEEEIDQKCMPNLDLTCMFEEELTFSLLRFTTAVKQLDDEYYSPNRLREILVVIAMYLHQNLFNVLNNAMKANTTQSLGLGQWYCNFTLSCR